MRVSATAGCGSSAGTKSTIAATSGRATTAQGSTWVDPAGPQGATWDRLARFESGGRTCVEARTTWAVIDRQRGRPVRVPAELAALFGQ